MKINKKSNSGFTLIELIIAMAMLAFVMTAVSAFMGSGVLGYKKSKADITVHNSAQETYNQIIDTVMQANDIVIYGYTTVNPTDEVYFQEEETLNTTFNPTPVYYVRDSEQVNYVINSTYYDGSSDVKLYSELADNQKIYVKQIIVDTATPFDPAYASSVGLNEYYNNFTGKNVKIEPQSRQLSSGTSELVYSVNGDLVYTENDTLRTVYTFDAENLYCETEYAYMTALNDKASGSDKFDYLYSESFNYGVGVTSSGTEIKYISGCVAVVDVNNGAISVDLNFSDKNMTYETSGKVKFRNSYVLRAKQ